MAKQLPHVALANLLAHETVGKERMGSAGAMEGLLRSAKDLGRVLALAWLAGREETEAWLPRWSAGLAACFPDRRSELAKRAGAGLRELLDNSSALEEARITADIGLLSGRKITGEMLKATGERLFQDVLGPLAEMADQPANPTS